MPENNIVLKHIEIAKKIYKYIIDNKILKGDKLPGGRTFAVKYNVSKNTVYEALELLQADGYVVIKKDSGTFVTDKIWNTALSGSPNWDAYINNSWSHNRNEILDNVFCDESRIEDDVIYLSQDCLASKFNASLYLNKALDIIPYIIQKNKLFTQYLFQGDPIYRKIIAEYLNKRWYTDIVQIENMILTPGMPNSIDSLIRGIISRHDIIYTESPTFFNAVPLILSLGQQVAAIECDEEGICIDKLYKNFKRNGRHIICVTPTCRYPNGKTMSLKRRIELLEFAYENKIPVIEFDNMFDMENILPPLYVLDKHNIVIHAGSIAYPYAFGLGIGWIIAPDYLLNRLAVVSMETNHYPSQINHLITSVMLSENVNGGGIYNEFVKQFIPLRNQHLKKCENLFKHHISDIASWDTYNERGLYYIKMNNDISVKKMMNYNSMVRFASGSIFSSSDTSYILINGLSLSLKKLNQGLEILKYIALKSNK